MKAISYPILIICVAVISWSAGSVEGVQDSPEKGAIRADFEVSGPRLYNYNKLARPEGKERVTLQVRNLKSEDLELAGSIAVPKLVDTEGKAAELIFRMVEPRDTARIGPKEHKEIAFELFPCPKTLTSGKYKGEINLTPASKDKNAMTVPFALVVDPNVELLKINQSHDYMDLVSTGPESFVAVILRNKAESAISINATISGQENILTGAGTPVNLMFQRVVPNEKGSFVLPAEPDEIGPGRTVTLYFKLLNPGLQPAPGMYSAFLVVKSDNGAAIEPTNQLSIYVPSKDSMEANTYWKSARAWLLQWPSRWSIFLFGRKLELDAFDWAIVLVLVAYVIRGVVLYSRRHRLGMIEIEKITDATDKNLKIQGLEALLKDTLENLGLSPPRPQPISAISTDIGEIIVKSGIPAVGIFKAGKEILTFVSSIVCPPIGHKACITLRTSASGFEAIVEIKNARTARTEEIRADIAAETAEDAVRRSAHSIYLHAMNQKHVLSRTPEWRRFATLEGFESYQMGKRRQEEGKTEAAINDYQKAATHEIGNALILLSLGASFEHFGRIDDAMEVYKRMVIRWPEMIEPRYRLAATYSYHKDIKYLEMASDEWRFLIKALKWHRRFLEWLATFKLFNWRADIRGYLWTFSRIWPWGLNRRQYLQAVEVAGYCTEIQKHETEHGKILEILDKMDNVFWSCLQPRWKGIDWNVSYNGACAYSLALASLSKGDEKAQEKWSQKGVKLLDDVMRDPKSASIRDWLLTKDPDLNRLRDFPAFKAWADTWAMEVPEPVSATPIPVVADSLAQGWELLAAGAGFRRHCWAEHQKTLLLWPVDLDARHLSEIREWYQREADIWAAVVELAMTNGESRQHKPFWDELMQDRVQGKPLPALSAKTEAAKVMTYKRRWHQLTEHARGLHDKWDHKEDWVRSAITETDKLHPVKGIGDALEAAMECWRKLETWAKNPLNKPAEDDFLQINRKKGR